MTIKVILETWIVLLFSLLSGGLLSILFGKELCWDLASYHYYNPYAFIHHRSVIDYWPVSFIQQYLNPTMDFFTYFLINYFPPRTTEFILGAIHGINFWLVYLISRLFIPTDPKIGVALFIALVGACGPIALPSIGSFQNDHLIAIFVLTFTLLYITALHTYSILTKMPYKLVLISGLVLGMGTGLKLTAGIFVIGAIATTMMLPVPLNLRLRLNIILVVSITLGICLTSYYWMYEMWLHHKNPLFPFLNNIFHSSDFSAINWRDVRFLPHNSFESFFFPFYFSWNGRISDMPFRDFRFMIVYMLFFITGLQLLRIKLSKKIFNNITLTQAWLLAFFIVSYLIWQYYFSIARYLLPLELLSPLIIYLLLKILVKDQQLVNIVIIIIFSSLLILMKPIQLTRANWYENTFFNVTLPHTVKDIHKAKVLIAYPAYVADSEPRPQTYLIPFFPSYWQFVGVPFIHHRFMQDQSTALKIQAIIHTSHDPIYLLTDKQNMSSLYHIAKQFGLKSNGECMLIFSDRQKITRQIILLCPVARTS